MNSEINLKKLGGPGSGFHGHAGRPGRRGGSAPRKSSEVKYHDYQGSQGPREAIYRFYQELSDKEREKIKEYINIPSDQVREPFYFYTSDPVSEVQKLFFLYTGGGFREINNYLRKDKKSAKPESSIYQVLTSDEIEKAVQTIDRLFQENSSTLPRNTYLYRGISGASNLAASLRSRLEKGETNIEFSDLGFVSTSLSPSSAAFFGHLHYRSQMPNQRQIMLKIRAPKGLKVLPVLGSEAEVILNRGSRFRIVKVIGEKRYRDYQKQYRYSGSVFDVFEVELVQQKNEKNLSEAIRLGGSGSGYHGHAGRPGKRGGSLPRNALSLDSLVARGIEPWTMSLSEFYNIMGVKRVSDSDSKTMSKEEYQAAIEKEFKVEDLYDRAIKERLALGLPVSDKVLEDEGAWLVRQALNSLQDFPQESYHVCTAKKQILEDGLKSRQELGMKAGIGLGGGDDSTISVTTNFRLAKDIFKVMREAQQVAAGKLTIREIWEDAKSYGEECAARCLTYFLPPPSLGLPEFKYDFKNPDNVPAGLKELLEGYETIYSSGDPNKSFPIRGSRWRQDKKDPKVWKRKLARSEVLERTWRFYSEHFLRVRQEAGGPEDPLFFGTDWKKLAKVKSENIAILKVRPKPGAKGFPVSGMDEWRIWTGKALEVEPIDLKSLVEQTILVYMDGLKPFSRTMKSDKKSGIGQSDKKSELIRSIDKLIDLLRLGGPGSGHHGHAGRPGKRGGSAPKEYRAYTREEFDSVFQSLTTPEYRDRYNCGDSRFVPKSQDDFSAFSVWRYVNDAYLGINSVLREAQNTGKSIEKVTDFQRSSLDDKFDTLDLIAGMDAAFAEAPRLPEPTVVYRGIPFDSVLKRNFDKLEPGFIIKDPKFGSTSLSRSLAEKWAGFPPEYLTPENEIGALLEIRLPKGTKFIYPNTSEQELILDRDGEYRVIDVRKEKAVVQYKYRDPRVYVQHVLVLERLPEKQKAKKLGGPGSGHHGHAGRPGKRGGSAPRSIYDYQDYTGREADFLADYQSTEEGQRFYKEYLTRLKALVFRENMSMPKEVHEKLKSLINYINLGHSPINRYLRNSDAFVPYEDEEIPEIRKRISDLDALFKEVPGCSKDMIVYREIHHLSQTAERFVNEKDRLIGKIIRDEGFCSTTIDRDVAEKMDRGPTSWWYDHMRIPGEGIPARVLFKIKVPKGTRGIYIENEVREENEFLLNRGLSFRVVSVEKNHQPAYSSEGYDIIAHDQYEFTLELLPEVKTLAEMLIFRYRAKLRKENNRC